MCLIKGNADLDCKHLTCIRFNEDPDFYYGTKSNMFHKQGDFNKVLLFNIGEDTSFLLQPRNPHRRKSGNWIAFERFRRDCTFRIAGEWPPGKVFPKNDIGFEYFLFARRIEGAYDPLTETYSYEITLDVEEAAVYRWKYRKPHKTSL